MLNVRTAIAAIALVFFFGPIGLRAAGVTARPFENRALATFPKPSQGWAALDQGKRFFADRLPLREQAVHADAWISTHVFDTRPSAGRAGARDSAGLPFTQPAPETAKPAPAAATPVDRAIVGKRGWLYLEGELVRACTTFIPWPAAMRRWQRMASIIRDSGRRVVIAFAPDKSTIYPEYLPDAFAQRDCLAPGRRAAWAAMEGATDPAILPLRRTMLAARRPPREAPYFRKDTHWNTMGGTIAVGAVLDRLGGRVRLRPDEIVKGRVAYQGDLTILNGTPENDTSPAWTITRRKGAPQIPGRMLFVHDSFGIGMQDALRFYPQTLALVQWLEAPPAELIAQIKSADTVILETVEREVNYRASDLGLLTPAFLDDLERALAPRTR